MVFATAGSHDPSFKRSTQASTWLIGLVSPSRPDLVPTVTMGSACSQHQKWFPGSRPVCSYKGFDGLLYVHDSLVQRDASESLYRKIAAQLDSTFVTLHTHSHVGRPALMSARIPHMHMVCLHSRESEAVTCIMTDSLSVSRTHDNLTLLQLVPEILTLPLPVLPIHAT